MKCEHCPLKQSEIPCVCDIQKHAIGCDQVNPDHARFNPEMAYGITKNSTDLYNKQHHPELIPPPTFMEKISNLAGAIEKIMEVGPQFVTQEIYAARLTQCSKCDFKKGWICTHPSCGCVLAAKAKLSTEACPIGKWGVEFLEMEEVNSLRSVTVDQMMREAIVTMGSGDGGCNCSAGK